MTGWMVAWGWTLLDVFNVVVLGYFFLLNASYLLTSLVAFGSLRKHALRQKNLPLQDTTSGFSPPPVTLIAPAYNEEPTCVESVRALLSLEYASFEVLVVNDGSTDGTLGRLQEEYHLEPAARFPTARIPTETVRGVWRSRTHPNLWVVDKENGGKADALNAGLNHARNPLFCAMDADSILERDALSRLVQPFVEDDRLVAAGGIIRIVNGCEIRDGTLEKVRLPESRVARFQVLEYLRAFLTGRLGWDALDATLIIAGAFGVFRRSAVVDAGGYHTRTVGEDMELVVRLHRHFRERKEPYRIGFVPDPVAWTECPETLEGLGQQRDRWQRGLIESLTRHVRMLLNPRYGRIGLLAFPYFFFLEMLGPLIEFGGYVGFAATVAAGRASGLYIVTFLALAVAFGVAVSIAAVSLEELTFRRYPRLRDVFRLFGLAVVENFGYRQLVTYWRFRGIVSKLRRIDTWGPMERKGFGRRDRKDRGDGGSRGSGESRGDDPAAGGLDRGPTTGREGAREEAPEADVPAGRRGGP